MFRENERWNRKAYQQTQETSMNTAHAGSIAQKESKLNKNCQVTKLQRSRGSWGGGGGVSKTSNIHGNYLCFFRYI